MTSPCERITAQLGLHFTCEPIDQYIKIQTPFLYPDGDVIDLFYKESGDTITLTDLGETLGWLRMQTTVQRRSPRQRQLIAEICLTHNITFSQGMFQIQIKQSEDLIGAVMRLSQGILRVSDLWFTFRNKAGESIVDELEDLFQEHRIRFERDPHIQGRSTRIWQPNFQIKHKNHNILIGVLSTGSRAASHNLAANTSAMWHDLSHLTAGQEATFFVSLFDDTVDVWNEEDLRLVGDMSDIAYWSRSDEFLGKIA